MSRNRTETFVQHALSNQILDTTFWYAPRCMNSIFFQYNIFEKLFSNIFSKLLGYDLKVCKIVYFHTHWEFFFDLLALNLKNKFFKIYKKRAKILYSTCYNFKHTLVVHKLLDCFYYRHLINCDLKYKSKQIQLVQARIKNNIILKYCFTKLELKNNIKIYYKQYISWLNQCIIYICRFMQILIVSNIQIIENKNFEFIYFCCVYLFKKCIQVAQLKTQEIIVYSKSMPAFLMHPTKCICRSILPRAYVIQNISYTFGFIRRLFWIKRHLIKESRYAIIKRYKVLILIYQFYVYFLLKMPDNFGKSILHIDFILIIFKLVFKLSRGHRMFGGKCISKISTFFIRKHVNYINIKRHIFTIPLRNRLYIFYKPLFRYRLLSIFNTKNVKTLVGGGNYFTSRFRQNILLFTSLLNFFCKINVYKICNPVGFKYIFFNYLLIYFSQWKFLISRQAKMPREISYVSNIRLKSNFINRVLFFNFFFKSNLFLSNLNRIYIFNFFQKNLMSIHPKQDVSLLNFDIAQNFILKSYISPINVYRAKRGFLCCIENKKKLFFSLMVINKNLIKFLLNRKPLLNSYVNLYMDFKAYMFSIITQLTTNVINKNLIGNLKNMESYTFDSYQFFFKKYIYYLNLNFLKYICYVYSFYLTLPMATCQIYLAYQQVDLQLFSNFLNYIYDDVNKINFLYFKLNFMNFFFMPYLGFYMLIFKSLSNSTLLVCDIIVDFIYYVIARVIKTRKYYRIKHLLYIFNKIFSDFINMPDSPLVGIHLSIKGRLRKTTQRKQQIMYTTGCLHYTTLQYKVFSKKRYFTSVIGVSTLYLYLCFKGKLSGLSNTVL